MDPLTISRYMIKFWTKNEILKDNTSRGIKKIT